MATKKIDATPPAARGRQPSAPAPAAPEMRLTHAHHCQRTPDWDDLWRRLLLGPRRPDDADDPNEPGDTRQAEEQEQEEDNS